ncbi:MAG: hypothetical protein GY845_25905 [Planctomycetes bacterium]|nr:hypothetical protein [Planctomycetota bacterium]
MVKVKQINMKTKEIIEIEIDRMDWEPEITPYQVRIKGKVINASTLRRNIKSKGNYAAEIIRIVGSPDELRASWEREPQKIETEAEPEHGQDEDTPSHGQDEDMPSHNLD